MLIFVLVFAVLGGGYLLFTSFAATAKPSETATWYHLPAAYGGFWFQSPNGSINNPAAIVVYPSPNANPAVPPVVDGYERTSPPFNRAHWYSYNGIYYQTTTSGSNSVNLATYLTVPVSAPGTPQPQPAFGVEPPVSGKLVGADQTNFNANYARWAPIAWCIIGHESGGSYTVIQGGGNAAIGTGGPATGAFQFQGGYPNPDPNNVPANAANPKFGSGNSNTWANFYGYQYAAKAPPDVQWALFFQKANAGVGRGTWNHPDCWAL